MQTNIIYSKNNEVKEQIKLSIMWNDLLLIKMIKSCINTNT